MRKLIAFLLLTICLPAIGLSQNNTDQGSRDDFNIKKLPVLALPILGWNNYDKTMLGAVIFNFSDKNDFSFALAPKYAFGSKSLVGMANLFYPVYPESNLIDKVSFSLQTKSYNYNYRFDLDEHERYYKIQPKIKINFTQKSDTSYTFHSLQYRYVFINQKYNAFNVENGVYENATRSYYVNELKYEMENKRFSDLHWEVILQQGKGFTKLFTHFNQLIPYGVGEKGVNLHLFAGNFFSSRREDIELPAQFLMSGTTGFDFFQKDYLFDDVMLGRNDRTGIFSKQIFERDANLKTLSNIASTTRWMVGGGLKFAVPGKIPIKPYFDVTIWSKESFDQISTEVAYSGGLALIVFPDLFEIYFPVPFLESNNIKEGSVYQNLPGFFQRMTFSLKLQKIDPFKYLDRLKRRN